MSNLMDLLTPRVKSILEQEGIHSKADMLKFRKEHGRFTMLNGIGHVADSEINSILIMNAESLHDVMRYILDIERRLRHSNAAVSDISIQLEYWRSRFDDEVKQQKFKLNEVEANKAKMAEVKKFTDSIGRYHDYITGKLDDNEIPYVSFDEYQAIQSGEL